MDRAQALRSLANFGHFGRSGHTASTGTGWRFGSLCAAFVLVSSFAVACSSSSNEASVSGTQPDAGNSEGTPATPEEDGGATVDGSDTPSDDVPAPTACPTAEHKTVVIVGDSISDVGGSGPGEEPFYRTLLVKNHDARYPAWKGFDLATCWKLDPATNIVKVSEGGAIATIPNNNDPKSRHILVNQVKQLPPSLPGPVLVVGTIGGNDVVAGLPTQFVNPGRMQALIDAYAAGFGAAMAELATPDRFGKGVKVDVLMTNIFDPSGGTGNFYYEPGQEKCPGLGIWPEDMPTAPLLKRWNDAMAAEAAKHDGVKLVDMKTLYDAHAVSTKPGVNWFSSDCIHPNSAGHHAIRALFWQGMRALQ